MWRLRVIESEWTWERDGNPRSHVFIANGAIMTIELVAGRVVSPHIGMSLYTWTSIIGVVMAGMSVGHYLGGWLADRFRARRTLGLLFLLEELVIAVQEAAAVVARETPPCCHAAADGRR